MKLNFNLYSGNGAIVAIERIMQKPCGLVVLGEIKSSIISVGDTISVQTGEKIALYDEIKRIEVDYTSVTTATSGQLVGICLKNTSKEGLLEYLEKN